MPNPGQLEFYPGVHVMIWVVEGKPALWVQAWGGTDPIAGWNDGGMRPRKTTAGRFLIFGRAPYLTGTWDFSRLAWGTPLRVQMSGHEPVVMYDTGMVHPRWRPVSTIVPYCTTSAIQKAYTSLYGDTHLYDEDPRRDPRRLGVQ